MKKFILFFLILLSIGSIKAQDYQKIDSLKKVLNTLPSANGTERDTMRFITSYKIGQLFSLTSPDSTINFVASFVDTVFIEVNIKQSPRRSYYNAIALCYLGIVYKNQGDYTKSMEYYEKSLKIFEILEDKTGISGCFNNIGIVFEYQGDYPKAIEYDEKSLKINEDLGDNKGISRCLNNLGIVYYYQGNYPKAIEYYEKSLKIKEELSDKRGIFKCYINLGVVFMDQAEYPKALEYYQKALKITEELKDKRGTAMCMINLGIVFNDLGDYTKAAKYYEESLKINEEIGDKHLIAQCFNKFGKMFYDQGDYTKSIEYFEKSFKITEEIGLYVNLADEYPKLASVYIKLNQDDKAAPLYLKTVRFKRKLIQDNFCILSEREKGDFLTKTGEIFNCLNEFADITKADTILTQCYDNELLLKGLLLNNSSSMISEISKSKDTILTNTYWRLKQLRNKISELQSTPIYDRKLNVDSIANLANEEERKLVKLSKDFANLQIKYSYKWQDVQKKLNSNDIAIEFIRINYKLNRPANIKTDSIGYAALILRNDYKYPQIVSLCSELALLKMVGDLSWNDETLCKLIYKIDSKKGLRLYNFIWKPLEAFLSGVNTIYFAPVGLLNQISFSAIPTPDGRLLSDQFNLNLVSSTRVLIEKEVNKKLQLEDAVVFGGIKYDSDSLFIKSLAQYNKADETKLRNVFKKSEADRTDIKTWCYLSGTDTEANMINNLLKKKKIKTTYYCGYNGLEEIFKENIISPSIIHIATHGFCFPTPVKGMEYTLFENSFVYNLNPLFRSGLLFAGANRTWSGAKPIEGIEDGVLTAYEVSNLNLSNTKLVVLSACETGLGDLKGNEGVYGLQRAFIMAGVKYIVMSLWQVPDAQTVELMEYFYKELLSGNEIRKAFGNAQNKMKLKYEPYYWAGFVLVE